jgi:hypothetical protein
LIWSTSRRHPDIAHDFGEPSSTARFHADPDRRAASFSVHGPIADMWRLRCTYKLCFRSDRDRAIVKPLTIIECLGRYAILIWAGSQATGDHVQKLEASVIDRCGRYLAALSISPCQFSHSQSLEQLDRDAVLRHTRHPGSEGRQPPVRGRRARCRAMLRAGG